MNNPKNIIDMQTEHLLAIVENNKANKCNEILQHAQEESERIIKHAYREARNRLHRDIESVRNNVRQQLSSAEAHRQTRLREMRQRADQEQLLMTQGPLQEALGRRWQTQESRLNWIRYLIQQASITLIERNWQIYHPSDWESQERDYLVQLLQDEFNCNVDFVGQDEISAGLRICDSGACVDGTIDGLTRQKFRIESMMLAMINDCRDERDKAKQQ